MRRRSWTGWLMENGSYKVVALLVTLILWITIMARREVIVAREFPVSVLVAAPFAVRDISDTTVQVKVLGSRIALKRFQGHERPLEMEILRPQEGLRNLTIPVESVELPHGVRLLSINPSKIQVRLVREGDHGS